ncbi:MAG: CPBP family intramembrane metalloprotease [Ruminococcus sp.]|nr:CPBP family intramembrane metalloprotease [Ruminococcus sp.]
MRESQSCPETELSTEIDQALRHEAENKERTQLFINASMLAILLLLYELFNTLYTRVYWLAAYTRFTGKINLDVSAVAKYFNETAPGISGTTAFNMTACVFIVVLSTLSIFVIGRFMMGIPLHEVMRPYKKAVPDGLLFLPTSITFNLMAALLISNLTERLKEEGITLPASDFSVDKPTPYALVMQFIYICALGPVCEEFVYRGLCLKLLAPYGNGLAVMFSAVTFGLMHGNVKQAIPAMLSGAVYAMVAIRYGSIVPCIVIHIINNLIASIGDFGSALGISTGDLSRAIYIIVLFLGFYGAIVLFTELIEKLYVSEPKCVNSMAKRFLSVGTNIFCVIYFLYLIWDMIEKIIRANK